MYKTSQATLTKDNVIKFPGGKSPIKKSNGEVSVLITFLDNNEQDTVGFISREQNTDLWKESEEAMSNKEEFIDVTNN